jgi:hypothetical protein
LPVDDAELHHFENLPVFTESADPVADVIAGSVSRRAVLPWRFQPARCSIRSNTMAAPCALSLQGAPIVRFAKRQDVVAWVPTKLD